jgi:hypothetical protein
MSSLSELEPVASLRYFNAYGGDASPSAGLAKGILPGEKPSGLRRARG